MATSKWANSEQDAADDARRKREKEDKKRAKAEKQRAQQEAQSQAAHSVSKLAGDSDHIDTRPTKRRRLSEDEVEPDSTPLLRFQPPGWTRSRSISDFERLNPIEEGTYGYVSRARCRTSGTIVALKKIKSEPGSAQNGIPVTALREIQTLQRARHHRNIIELREVINGPLTPTGMRDVYLVMDFAAHDLKSLLEDMPTPFQPSEVKTLMLQLTSALSHLHSHWILHRDLKTSNILLTSTGTLKLADFGMARVTSFPPPAGLTGLVVTLWYRAPELLLGQPDYAFPVDMWSLGCVFGELVQREPVLQGRNEVDQLAKIFDLIGLPDRASWPGFHRLPNARTIRLPSNRTKGQGCIREKFAGLRPAALDLLTGLMCLNPDDRPTADEVLGHPYFSEDPRAKAEELFPTFPSKAGMEKRRRRQTPNAPARNDGVANTASAAVDFSRMFQ